MRLILVNTQEKQTIYSVYESKVCLAAYSIEKPETLTPEQVEELRITIIDSKA